MKIVKSFILNGSLAGAGLGVSPILARRLYSGGVLIGTSNVLYPINARFTTVYDGKPAMYTVCEMGNDGSGEYQYTLTYIGLWSRAPDYKNPTDFITWALAAEFTHCTDDKVITLHDRENLYT